MCMAQAMRTGSVRQLNEGLQANQAAFIRAGTFLLMEKLRQAVCRRLLKRAWLLHRGERPRQSAPAAPGCAGRCLNCTHLSAGPACDVHEY